MVDEMFDKIQKIAETLGKEKIKFVIRRAESFEKKEDFVQLHKKYSIEYKIGQNSSNSYGNLEVSQFMSFLKEFDKKFDLTTTLIDLEAVVINPLFL